MQAEQFEVLVQGLFAEDAVRAEYQAGRRIRWEPSAEKLIETIWEEYAKSADHAGIKVYNGNVFRLDSFAVTEGCLLLTLSDIDFRSSIGTGSSRFLSAFPHAPQANPLTVSAALITNDGKIVLEKRSRIDTRRRKYHVIAGFMEHDLDSAADQLNPFRTLRREIQEELGSAPEGPVYATSLVRAVYGSELCFFSRLRLSFDDLLQVQAGGGTDAEIDSLVGIDDAPAALASFLNRHPVDLVPSGRACLLMYGREAYGKRWYDSIVNGQP